MRERVAGVPITDAEYLNLREEIQNRSASQTELLKLHIGALTAIIGAALTLPLGPWVIAVLPIESALLGTWYVDHATRIVHLGWRGLRTSEWARRNALDLRSTVHFRRLICWTFMAPAIVGLSVVGAMAVITGMFFPTRLTAAASVVAAGGTIFGALLLRFYRQSLVRWYWAAGRRAVAARRIERELAKANYASPDSETNSASE